MRIPTLIPLVLGVLLAVSPATAQPVSDASGRAAEAVAFYDQGRYAEAARLLQQLDAEDLADGPLLYRLHYCLRVAGQSEASISMLHRARERLEQELQDADSLEVGFYLVNAYQNLERNEEMRRTAASILERVASGELKPGDDPLEAFRLGKLYADSGKRDEAAEWYARAIEGFSTAPDEQSSYIAWAGRYVGDLALARGDWELAERQFAVVASLRDATAADLDRLAVAQSRQGRHDEAAATWKRAEILAPHDADRARYLQRLAKLAAGLENLAEAAPDGRRWSQLSQQELEALLTEQAAVVGGALTEANEAPEPISQERRSELEGQIATAKLIFVSAAMEFALRGHNIREVAFFGGYARLIFREREWELPAPPRRRRRPKADPQVPPEEEP